MANDFGHLDSSNEIRPIFIGKWLLRIRRSANRHSVEKFGHWTSTNCRVEQVAFRASVVNSLLCIKNLVPSYILKVSNIRVLFSGPPWSLSDRLGVTFKYILDSAFLYFSSFNNAFRRSCKRNKNSTLSSPGAHLWSSVHCTAVVAGSLSLKNLVVSSICRESEKTDSSILVSSLVFLPDDEFGVVESC